MGIGSLMAYGAFAIKGILFLSPKRGIKAKKKIFVGTIDQLGFGYDTRYETMDRRWTFIFVPCVPPFGCLQ